MELLGIDVGGSGIKGALVHIERGEMITKRHRIPTPQPAKPEPVAKVVAEIVRFFEWTGPIGCAIPARVKKGVAHTAANIDDAWIGTNAAALFEKATGCPTVIINDADAAGVAEMRYGAGRGREGLVMLFTFGTGIGSAFFYDGTLIPNTELGHLDLRGRHAETYASDRARKRDNLSWEAWAERVQEYLEHVEFLMDPDLIILGGGISREHKREEYLHLLDTHAELAIAELENEAGIIGAAYNARSLLREARRP